MNIRRTLLVSVLLVSSLSFAGTKISAADLATYSKLLYARQLADARKMYAGGDKAKRDQADAEYEKTVKGAGWSEDKFGEVDAVVNEISGNLYNQKNEPENAKEYQEQLSAYDESTIAWVKSHSADVDTDTLRQKAEAVARAEKNQASLGRAPTEKELQGTWKFDADATIAELGANLPDDAKRAMKQSFEKNMTDSSYSFSGNTVTASIKKMGDKAPSVSKGTYKIDGNDVTFSNGKSESKLKCGLRGKDELIITMMGMGTVYRKQ